MCLSVNVQKYARLLRPRTPKARLGTGLFVESAVPWNGIRRNKKEDARNRLSAAATSLTRIGNWKSRYVAETINGGCNIITTAHHKTAKVAGKTNSAIQLVRYSQPVRFARQSHRAKRADSDQPGRGNTSKEIIKKREYIYLECSHKYKYTIKKV